MPYLVLKSADRKEKSYRLPASRRIRIGRAQSNDVTLDDAAVSSVHAEIEPEGKHFYLTDFNSRNGTFVNRELVISRRLAHGDVISMGNHTLLFVYGKDEQQPAAFEEGAHQATMQIDTEDHRARLARGVAEIAEQETEKSRQGLLSFLSEQRPPLRLEKPSMTIGKDPGADIRVRGWRLGRTEATIEKTPAGYELCPASARSRVKLNYQPLRSRRPLREFDVIEAGATMLQFHY